MVLFSPYVQVLDMSRFSNDQKALSDLKLYQDEIKFNNFQNCLLEYNLQKTQKLNLIYNSSNKTFHLSQENPEDDDHIYIHATLFDIIAQNFIDNFPNKEFSDLVLQIQMRRNRIQNDRNFTDKVGQKIRSVFAKFTA